MIFTSHPGLRSIGIAASLGLAGNLFTYTTLVPGMLRIIDRRRGGAAGAGGGEGGAGDAGAPA